MVLHPLFLVINALVLGKFSHYLPMAAFGLASLTTSMFLLAIPSAFNSAVDIMMSKALGEKDYRMAKIYMYRQMWLSTLAFVPISVLVLYSEELFIMVG